MTSLPVCHYWIFSNTGLLIQDWLLYPPRPLDLTNSWRQTSLELVKNRPIVEHVPNEELQIILYFAFPLLPVLTMLIALINIVHEAKNYMCPRKVLASRPYVTRLSHSLMVFFVLALIASTLTWTGSLMRYIPMSSYAEQHSSSSASRMAGRSTRMNGNGSRSMRLPIQGTQFVAQLPAILTMQAVLRLTLIWVILGLMTGRVCVLNRLIHNPKGPRIKAYIQSMHELCGLNCREDVCPLRSIFTEAKYNTDKEEARTYTDEVTSGSRSIVKETAKNICLAFRDSGCACDGAKQTVRCCAGWTYEKEHGTCSTRRPNGKSSDSGQGAVRKIGISETTCSVGQTFMTTAFLICFSLGVCLPQLWAYQLNRVDKDGGAQSENLIRQRKWITWQLTNRTGRALYEYGLAIVGFVIPGCLLLANVMLLITKVWMSQRQLRRVMKLDQNCGDQWNKVAHESLAMYCASCLNRDSWLVLMLGFCYIFCWLPHATVTTVHRLNCLLNTDHTLGLFSMLDRNAWPKQVGWLWIELILLCGDLFSQIVLLLIRLCEPVCKIPSLNQDNKSHPPSCCSDSPEVVRLDCKHLDDKSNDYPMNALDEMNYTDHLQPAELSPVRSPLVTTKTCKSQMHVRPMIPVVAPSDDGQTSQNISPLPTSHTLSESIQPLQTRVGRTYPMLRHLEARSCHSNPSPYPSPLVTRISNCRGRGEPASLQLQPASQLSYNEPRSSTVLLTYSPRSRHPCRVRQEPSRFTNAHPHPPTPSSPNSQCPFWPPHPSPPPLPPPPRHLTSMIGADSSIYSTPHGSPNEEPKFHALKSSPDAQRVHQLNGHCSEEEDVELVNSAAQDDDMDDQQLKTVTSDPGSVQYTIKSHPHPIPNGSYSPLFS